jgi:hypothetical protein
VRSRKRRSRRSLQKALEEDPEAFEEIFSPKQPFDSNIRPFDIFECKGGGWSVVLSVCGGPDGNIRTVGPSARRKRRWHSSPSTRREIADDGTPRRGRLI